MKTGRLAALALSPLALSLFSLSAYAHTGSDGGAHHPYAFVAGFMHPFTGYDHLLAMLAVGLWSGASHRQLWAAPTAFAALLLVGALLGLAGIALPAVEPMIAASLLVLGLLLATRAAPTPLFTGVLVGAFALFHGLAHGAELPAQQAASTLTGMTLATLLLHATGLAIGHFLLRRRVWLPRVIGSAVALVGAGLLAL